MRIDYRRLSAFGDSESSEVEAGLANAIAEFVAKVTKQAGCLAVLDVGLRGRELAGGLQLLGIPSVSIDPFGPALPEAVSFDVTDVDPHRLEELTKEVHARLGTDRRLTTCLHLLERLHRCDLPTALWNLRELSQGSLLVSVFTRPSNHANLYHPTVVPRRTWRRLFEMLGFELVEMPAVGSMPHCNASHSEIESSVKQWRRIDPFRDAQEPEPYFMSLRKWPDAVSKLDFTAQARQILGLTDCESSHANILDPKTHITFLIGHYQDFHHYRPYWERLDRASVSIIVRDGALRGMDEPRYKAVLEYLRARGLDYQEVESVNQVRWNTTPGTRLSSRRNHLRSTSICSTRPSCWQPALRDTGHFNCSMGFGRTPIFPSPSHSQAKTFSLGLVSSRRALSLQSKAKPEQEVSPKAPSSRSPVVQNSMNTPEIPKSLPPTC